MGYIEKNKKKILAIFAAGLMVAFTLPSTFGGGGGRSGNDPVRATLGGKNVRNSDLQRAALEFQYLQRSVGIHDQGDNDPTHVRSILSLLPQTVQAEMAQHQDMYYLLLKDAQRMGVQVTGDQVQTLIVNNIAIPPNLTSDEEVQLRNAVEHFMQIREAARRAMSTIKITDPMRQHAMAEQGQLMTLKVVEIPAAEFRSKVATPSQQQLEEQFTAYGNKDKENPDPTNKFGFGYRYPTRVRVQYIELKRDDMKKAVQAEHSAYDWDVLAQKYYRQNESEFAQPTTKPSVKPFATVHQEILNRLQEQEMATRSQQILVALNQTLQSDYANYVKSPNSPSSVGPAYGTYDYLTSLASSLQKKFGVLLTVNSQAEAKSPKQLADLPGIGQAQMQNGSSFADYITTRVEPVATIDKEHAIKLLQPTPLMEDREQNLYIARAIEATPARMAADSKEVAMQMDADIRTMEAYDAAKNAAQQFIANAGKTSFDAVADSEGRKVTTTGPISLQLPVVANLTLDSSATQPFIQQAMSLINSDPAKTGAHPMTIIELPRQQKVYVAQLETLKPGWLTGEEYAIMGQVDSSLVRPYQMQFLDQWFSYNELAARNDYHLMNNKPA